MIEISDLSFSYGEHKVLEDLSYRLAEGEFSLISGANGSGKSTLLKILLGELEPLRGEVELFNQPISSELFRKIGYVPQLQTMQKMSFPITLEELVVMGLYPEFGLFKIPSKKHYARVMEVISELDLEAYKKIPVIELSGGLMQRSYIARAMVTSPKLYLFDEPTVGIDEESKKTFYKILNRLKIEGASILMISHEASEIKAYVELDSYYEMRGGRLHLV